MTIENEILEMQKEIAKTNSSYKENFLLKNHTSNWLLDKKNREKKSRERKIQKESEVSAFLEMEIKACQAIVANPLLLWYLENVLAPKAVMPKDSVELEIDPKIRRKQIEAITVSDLLDDILEKGNRKI